MVRAANLCPALDTIVLRKLMEALVTRALRINEARTIYILLYNVNCITFVLRKLTEA